MRELLVERAAQLVAAGHRTVVASVARRLLTTPLLPTELDPPLRERLMEDSAPEVG